MKKPIGEPWTVYWSLFNKPRQIRIAYTYPVECIYCNKIFYITIDKRETDEKGDLTQLFGICSECREKKDKEVK